MRNEIGNSEIPEVFEFLDTHLGDTENDSASEVRRALYNGGKSWRKMVGNGVEEAIEKITPLGDRIEAEKMNFLDKEFY